MTKELKKLIEENIEIIESGNLEAIGDLYYSCQNLGLRRQLYILFDKVGILYPNSVKDDIEYIKDYRQRYNTMREQFEKLAYKNGFTELSESIKKGHKSNKAIYLYSYSRKSRVDNLPDCVVLKDTRIDGECISINIYFEDNIKFGKIRYFGESSEVPFNTADIPQLFKQAFKRIS